MVKDGHLGGFVEGGDPRCFYPEMWDKLIKDFEVKKVIDVGCGQGHACKYFNDKGIYTVGIDGSEKVLENAVFEPIVIHDFTKGGMTEELRKSIDYDLIWCCEFVEHVEEQYIDNFLEVFSVGKVVAMTHAVPGQGGYHHVNEQEDDYWIKKMDKLGFIYDLVKTLEYRELAHDYFQKSGLVFIKKDYV